MALPMLVGGSECGPSNPLQGLSKRFDVDRGLQQDFFGPGRAGSSQEVFRSQQSNGPSHDQDAAKFFAKSPPPQFSGNAYDLSQIRGALPSPGIQQQQQKAPLADWASDFLLQQPLPQAVTALPNVNTMNASTPPVVQAVDSTHPSNVMQWSNGVPTWGMGMRPMSAFTPSGPLAVQHPAVHNDQTSWDREFDAQQLESTLASGPSGIQQDQPQQSSHEGDELARTAGLLLESVRAEQNPKFQNSQFLSLMTQLRDHKVVVKGNDMVENDGTTSGSESRVDVKGKGKAVDLPFSSAHHAGSINTFHNTFLGSTATTEARASYGEQAGSQEDANDAYFRLENEEFIRHWKQVEARSGIRSANEMEANWDKLQSDWDKFEASSQGIKPVRTYQFQKNNPYLRGDSMRTRHHSMHSDERLETVLELEAAVQRKMSDASAWFQLGVKQQEHEREQQALQALQRALDLDPSHGPGWLALAVSYTNDGRRIEAYDSIRQWVMRNETHQDTVRQHLAHSPEPDPEYATTQEKFSHLVQCLITMAQQSVVGEIDADIQIALAVLFNSNEDYDKAQDCFTAALSVRPDDWQLYNRVGATMANSGQAREAVDYYHRALELNPVYIRARFNLGISCINLKRYNEGAQHILDALSLQDAECIHDAEGLNDARGGLTTDALWDSLKTACLHMQRIDLATLCDRRDLEAFRLNYQMQ